MRDFAPLPALGIVDLEVTALLAPDVPGARWARARRLLADVAEDEEFAFALALALLRTDPSAARAFGDDVALLAGWLQTLAASRNTETRP